MIFTESDLEHRVIRKDAQGVRWQYSDSDGRPIGEGWSKVDPHSHPRAKTYVWVRPYHAVIKELRRVQRKPIADRPTDMISIDPRIFPKLDVGMGNLINEWRNKIRKQLEDYKNPFLAGDRIKIKGKEGIYYVKGVDPKTKKMVAISAVDKEDIQAINYENAERVDEIAPQPWDIHDVVKIKAGAVDKSEVKGEVVGFDNVTGKVRIRIGTGTIDTYPESIIGGEVRGDNAKVLNDISQQLDKDPDAYNLSSDKMVIDSLLRAVRDGRSSVDIREVAEDIQCTAGNAIPINQIRGIFTALHATGRGVMFYNPTLDSMNLENANAAIRLIANKRGIKPYNRGFGWKNITKANMQETYAYNTQDVMLPKEIEDAQGKKLNKGRVIKIEGRKAEVKIGDSIKTYYLGELKDLMGRIIHPDPTDPAAYGSINKNLFWLLRDREECKDYKKGDLVTVTSDLEDEFGKKLRTGEYARVDDATVDGKLRVTFQNGAKAYLSPRQVRQNRVLNDLRELNSKILFNSQDVYSTTTIIGGEKTPPVRVSVGGESKNSSFIEMNFANGDAYYTDESKYFDAVIDDRATQNQTHAILPMNIDEFPDRNRKTLVPNKLLMDTISKLYPCAKKIMIIRELRHFPGDAVSRVKPSGIDDTKTGFPADYPDIVRGIRKSTRKYQDYYEPSGFDAGYDYDPEKGEFFPEPKVGVEPVEKIGWADPFTKFFGKTPSRTYNYTASDLSEMQKRTPVKIRVIIDPTDKDVKNNFGVVHDIPYLARLNSEWNDLSKRPPHAKLIEQQDWDNKIKMSSDGINLYIEIGKNKAGYKSPKFPGVNGEDLTFHELMKMLPANKWSAWEGKYTKNDFEDKMLISSLFTYDPIKKRYQTRLSHYNEAHRLLANFFGHDYGDFVHEDVDKAFCFPADERKLEPLAKSYVENIKIKTSQIQDVIPKEARIGFRWKRMDDSPEGGERGYQRETIDWLMKTPVALLANDQGTGKSACLLGSIIGRFNKGEARRALIICPPSLVASTWPKEIETWCKDQSEIDKIEKDKSLSYDEQNKKIFDLEASVDYGLFSTKNKEKFMQQVLDSKGPFIGVTSYNMAVLHAKELQRLGFDIIALDEAQNIKTGETDKRRGAQRTEVIKDAFGGAKFKIAMSGTPVETSPEDLHSIVSFLNPSLFGSAEQFMQDFVDIDFVKTAEGLKPICVSVKNIGDLHARMQEIFYRVSKKDLEKREQEIIEKSYAERGKASEYNHFLHYGTVTPRLLYPITSLDPDTGKLKFKDLTTPYKGYYDPKLGDPIDLDLPNTEFQKKYKDYIRAVKKANQTLVSEFKGFSKRSERYGAANIRSNGILIKMQQVLNDPYILRKDERFGVDPDYNNPDMPNPKFDTLMNILNAHDAKPFDLKSENLEFDPLNMNPRSLKSDISKREHALNTRGKTIIFCQLVETMEALKNRLEKVNDGAYKGRIVMYAGTQRIAGLSGKTGGGKAMQKEHEELFQNDPEKDILIANDAAQTGLNLPQADLVVNYEMNWNPRAMDQRIDRAHRLGVGKGRQYRPVTAYNLITRNSVEEKKARSHAFRNLLFGAFISNEAEAQKVAKMRFVSDPALMAENKSAVIQDMINDNKDLQNVMSMSAGDVERSVVAKKAQNRMAAVSKKIMTPKRKQGIIGKVLGWL